jgi:hypothetical protein
MHRRSAWWDPSRNADVTTLSARYPLGMSRRADPERIFAARKAATIERLVADGVPRSKAEAWIASWESGIADVDDVRQDPRFWESGYIFAHRQWELGDKPPSPRDPSSDDDNER